MQEFAFKKSDRLPQYELIILKINCPRMSAGMVKKIKAG